MTARGRRCTVSYMRAVCSLAFFAALSAAVGARASPADAEYRLTVTREYHNPDGYWRQVYKVNGQFPGPTIRVTNGGRLIVNVENLSDQPISIHWHGVELQPDAVWYDGVSMGTQCAIEPGAEMIYNFTVSQAPGVMMWHSHHYAGEADGLHGAFIIEPNDEEPSAADLYALDVAQDYDEEIVIDVMDWSHANGLAAAQRMAPDPLNKYAAADAGLPYHFFGLPDSVLLNGMGHFQCTPENGIPDLDHSNCWPLTEPLLGSPGEPTVSGGTPVFNFTRGKRYLLRVINSGTYAPAKIEIAGHTLILMAADGSPIQPIIVGNVRVNVGESYDVLVEANGEPGAQYVLKASMEPNFVSQQAIVSYSSHSLGPPPEFKSAPLLGQLPDYTGHIMDLSWIRSAMAFPEEMQSLWPDRTLYMDNYQLYDLDDRLTWPINKHEFRWDPSGLPLLPLAKYGLLSEGIDEPENNVFRLEKGEVVDIVLVEHAQTWAPEVGVTRLHPWHLHGMKFWYLGSGPNRFNRTDPEHQALLNLRDPARRDMAVLGSKASFDLETEALGGPFMGSHCYINDTSPECLALERSFGWTVIRVKADSPGVWAFHCHHLWHYLTNMRAFIVVAPEEVSDMPAGLPQTCGSPDTWAVVNGLAGLQSDGQQTLGRGTGTM